MAAIKISTTISEEFNRLLRQYRIKKSEALRVGAAICLAEKGVTEYDNTLQLHRKMRLYQTKVVEQCKEIEALHKRLNGKT